jgi:hypothetical protein
VELPRKGILIRIIIYGAALAFFGTGAIKRCLAEREAERAASRDTADLPTKRVTLPDGSEVEILELTEAQFEAHFGQPPPRPSAAPPDGGEAKPAATGAAPPAAAPAETASPPEPGGTATAEAADR